MLLTSWSTVQIRASAPISSSAFEHQLVSSPLSSWFENRDALRPATLMRLAKHGVSLRESFAAD